MRFSYFSVKLSLQSTFYVNYMTIFRASANFVQLAIEKNSNYRKQTYYKLKKSLYLVKFILLLQTKWGNSYYKKQ